MILNRPIMIDDILREEEICGPSLGALKRKTIRCPTEHVYLNWQHVPSDILERHGNVTWAIKIMAINKIPCEKTTSRNTHFGTSELIQDKQQTTNNKYNYEI